MQLQKILPLMMLFHAGLLSGTWSQERSFPPERCVVFSCISWDDEIDDLYFRTLLKDPRAPISVPSTKPSPLILGTGNIKVASSFRSEPQPYLGPAIIEFFTSPPLHQSGSRLQIEEPVSSVLLPPDQNHLLLVFFKQRAPAGHASPQYRIEIIPDNLESRPMGGYLIMNSTGKTLIGRAGEHSFELQAHATKTLPPPSDTSQNLEWVFWNESRKEKPLYSSVWEHRPDSKTLVFITESAEQRGALAIKAIQDRTDPASPEVEASRSK